MEQIIKKDLSLLNIRLANIMQENGYTINLLAQKANVAVGTVQKIMNDPFCNPTISSLVNICRVLNISIGDLIGQPEKFSRYSETSIPLLKWDTLKNDLKNLQKNISNYFEEGSFIFTSCPVSEEAFALKVMGNSMSPIFPAGTMLIFDRNKPYFDGCYVLVKLKEVETIVMKQLLIDEPNFYLKSINLIFNDKIIPLDKKNDIIATLLQAQMQY